MAASTFTATGAKATTKVSLPGDIFEIESINHKLLHQAYQAYLANGRINLGVTKTRGEVSGSNRKPWKQKGTGRARVGSKRTPVWRGGGIVFGPTGLENYSQKINRKAKLTAIRHALSAANQSTIISVIDSIDGGKGKTGELASLLTKINANGRVLIVTDERTTALTLAANNLAKVKICSPKGLNVAEVMNADSIVITKPALKTVIEWLTPTAKAKKGDS